MHQLIKFSACLFCGFCWPTGMCSVINWLNDKANIIGLYMLLNNLGNYLATCAINVRTMLSIIVDHNFKLLLK